MTRAVLRFLRNGKPAELTRVGPNETLLDYLRLRERAVGTKEGCNEGDCGACTVALGRRRGADVVYEPVNACIQLLAQIDGCDLVTVDDLAGKDGLHPVQEAMVSHHGSQCGFCTPGIVMALFALYHSGERPDRQMVNDWLAGNLCRCTGYRPIVDAAFDAISGSPADAVAQRKAQTLEALEKLDDGKDLLIGDDERFVAAPASLSSLAGLYDRHRDATLVAGATDVGLWITKQLRDLPKIVLTGRIPELCAIAENDGHLEIGAAVSYADAHERLAALDPDIGEILRRLGSRQVRASGTVGGNIANGSPIGDSPPVLIALGARLVLQRGASRREIDLEDFFLDYGKQDRAPGEFVHGIRIPLPGRQDRFRAFKISKRFDQDISAVMAAFSFRVSGERIERVRIAYGGMAATPKRARAAEAALAGKLLDDPDAASSALSALEQDFRPISDMRASAQYRMQIARNLLSKALFEIGDDGKMPTRVIARREAAALS